MFEDAFQLFNPCQNGHIWTWGASSTSELDEPNDDLSCACGQMTWGEAKQIEAENYESWVVEGWQLTS